MKKIIILLALILFFYSLCYAEERHTFYEYYNPSSTSWVYDSTGDTATGDTASVFTYDKKTIFINAVTIGSTSIMYQIEGRAVGEIDKWSILDSGEFGAASANTARNFVIDVTELVDFIRVGLRIQAGDNSDSINVRGIFRKAN